MRERYTSLQPIRKLIKGKKAEEAFRLLEGQRGGKRSKKRRVWAFASGNKNKVADKGSQNAFRCHERRGVSRQKKEKGGSSKGGGKHWKSLHGSK